MVDGRRVEIAGTSLATVTAVEDLAGADSSSDRGWLPLAVGVAAVATVAVVAVLLVGRRRPSVG